MLAPLGPAPAAQGADLITRTVGAVALAALATIHVIDLPGTLSQVPLVGVGYLGIIAAAVVIGGVTSAAGAAATGRPGIPPGKLRARELVLLHGQPGSAADWLQVAGRLPAELHVIAADRPGYGSSQLEAMGFFANARALLDDLDHRGIQRVVLVGHSYGGGVALAAAGLAPHRVEAVVLLASVGPGCVIGWDRLLAAPGAGQLCALVAFRLTPWIARARLARIARRRGRW